jgi:hypothetical protein
VPRRRVCIAAVPVLLVVLTAMVTAAGLVANREGATDTRQEAVAYSLDPDTKRHAGPRAQSQQVTGADRC